MLTEETRKKMSIAAKARKSNWIGRKHSEETKRKMSEAHWIKDRMKLKTNGKHGYDSNYKNWMLGVKNRDKWLCKINNKDCRGKVVAHHILSWRNYPELRYEINNGITLCKHHHPVKWEEEKRLAPTFQELVAEMSFK